MSLKIFLWSLAAFDVLAAAVPAWETSSGAALVHMWEDRASHPGLGVNLSDKAQVLKPQDDEFMNGTTRWSSWSAPSFSIGFIPATEKDISIALKYMTRHNVPFLAKGGGHGTSLSLSKVKNAVMINMENFNEVRLNKDMTLTVGGGAKFAELYEVAYNAGRELTLGSCPCVGATGAAMGGGHGRLQGKRGLTADAILGFRVALWNGKIINVSAKEHADLFWAMRGAGHNFGIVLETTFQTFPQDNNGMHYTSDMVVTNDSLEGVVSALNDLLPLAPELAIDLLVLSDQSTLEPFIILNIVYAGPFEQGQKYSDIFSANNSDYKIQRLSFNESEVPWNELNFAASVGAVEQACVDGPSTNIYSLNTARFDVAQTREAFDAYAAFVKANPLAYASSLFWEVFAMQAVVDQPAEATAVGNREFADVLVAVEAIYTDDSVAEAADEWAREWRDRMADPKHSGYDREYVYVNYAHGDEPREAIYGYEPWRLQRLRALKKRYDPHGFFNGFHPVRQGGRYTV